MNDFNNYSENTDIKEQFFETPSGYKISWSALLAIKTEIFIATNEEITLQEALKIADIGLGLFNK